MGTAQFDIVDVSILTYLFALSFAMSNRAHQLTIMEYPHNYIIAELIFVYAIPTSTRSAHTHATQRAKIRSSAAFWVVGAKRACANSYAKTCKIALKGRACSSLPVIS